MRTFKPTVEGIVWALCAIREVEAFSAKLAALEPDSLARDIRMAAIRAQILAPVAPSPTPEQSGSAARPRTARHTPFAQRVAAKRLLGQRRG